MVTIAMALLAAPGAQARTAHRPSRPSHKRHTKLPDIPLLASSHVLAPRPDVLQLAESFVAVLTENNAAQESENGVVVTLVEVAFPVELAGDTVEINDRQLYAKCKVAPGVVWLTPEEALIAIGPAVQGVTLNEEGEAFVLLVGDASCQTGRTLIEASLEEAPYQSVITEFTVLPHPEESEF